METLKTGKIKRHNRRHEPEVSKQTGFPSAATHYMEPSIDLHKELIIHQEATFFIRVLGTEYTAYDIYDGDVLLVDKAILPKEEGLIILVVEGAFAIRRFKKKEAEEEAYFIWGVITYIIHYSYGSSRRLQ